MKYLNIKKEIFVLSFVASLLVVACSKKLDIEPKEDIDASIALTNTEDVNAAVIGCYSIMGKGDLYGTSLFLQPDLLGADPDAGATTADRYATWVGTFQGPRQVYTKSMTRDNTEASRTWIKAYEAINMANNVLGALNVVTDPAKKIQFEGEALFVRGIMHFELVRLYALPWGATINNTQLGVVIRTKATKTEADAFEITPRSTVAQVYTQVINDLTAAVTRLPESGDEGRATKYTALAFLSRIYLQQNNYVKALDASNQVIASGNYKLNASVAAVFSNKNTAESIWEIQQNDQNNAGNANDGMATFYASFPGIGRADMRVSPGFVTAYPTNDLRRTEWYYIGTGARPGNTYTSKWKAYAQNLPVIRIAEMYLTRAECNLRLASSVGATPAMDLATVRNNTRTNSTAPIAPTLNNILEERMLELAFEGVRIHDIKRLHLSAGIYPWNDDKLVFPIPQREVDATNGIIVQNPGY